MRLRNKTIIRGLAVATAYAIKGLFLTLRTELHLEAGIDPYDPPADRRFIWSVWHDATIMPVFGRPQSRTSGLVSLHRDGTFVECLLKCVNMPVVRGSSSGGGTKALRELLEVSRSQDIVVTPDGPRGPRRVIKSGIVYLASRSGNSIVPTGFATSRCWRIHGSWTDQVIPKPFSRLILLVGQPIAIPRDVTRDQLSDYVAIVQSEMERLDAKAFELLSANGQRKSASSPSPVELHSQKAPAAAA